MTSRTIFHSKQGTSTEMKTKQVKKSVLLLPRWGLASTITGGFVWFWLEHCIKQKMSSSNSATEYGKGKQKKKKQKRNRVLTGVRAECGASRMENTFKQNSRGFPAGFSNSCLSLSLFHRMRASDFNLVPVLEIKGDRSYPQSIRLFSSNSSLFVSAEGNVAETFRRVCAEVLWRIVQCRIISLFLPALDPARLSAFFHGMKNVIWNKPQRGRLLLEHVCAECILEFPSVWVCVSSDVSCSPHFSFTTDAVASSRFWAAWMFDIDSDVNLILPPATLTHKHKSERVRDSRAQRWHWIKTGWIFLWRLDLFKLRVVCVAFIKVDRALIFLLAGPCVCVCVFTTWLKGTASTLISYCLVQCRSDGQPAEEVNSFLLNFCSFVVGGTIALHWVTLSFWEKPAAAFLHYKSNIGLQKGHGCFWTKHVHGLRFLNNRRHASKWNFWNTCRS